MQKEPSFFPCPVSWESRAGQPLGLGQFKAIVGLDRTDCASRDVAVRLHDGGFLCDETSDRASIETIRCVTDDALTTPLGPEGYEVEVGEGVTLRAASTAGLRWAAVTLCQMVDTESGALPRGIVRDRPALSIRAAQYDYARGMWVRAQYLKKLIDRLAVLKFNRLFLYIEDIAVFVRPELNKGSLGPADMRQIARYGDERGVQVVPTINAFGHARLTLAHDEYSHLAETPALGTFCPRHPDLHPFLEGVFAGLAETFPCDLVHVGLDEIFQIGLCERCRKATYADLYLNHLNWMVEALARLGKRAAYWADFPARYFPEMLPHLPKDALATAWAYCADERAVQLERLCEAGIPAISGPSTGCKAVFPTDARVHPANVRNYAREAVRLGAEGMLATAWEHSGHFYNDCFYALGIAAEAMWNPAAMDRADTAVRMSTEVFDDPSGVCVEVCQALSRLHISELADGFDLSPCLMTAAGNWFRSIPEALAILEDAACRAESLPGIAPGQGEDDQAVPRHLRLAAGRFAHYYRSMLEARSVRLSYDEAAAVQAGERAPLLTAATKTIRRIIERLDVLQLVTRQVWDAERDSPEGYERVFGRYAIQKESMLKLAVRLEELAGSDVDWLPPAEELGLPDIDCRVAALDAVRGEFGPWTEGFLLLGGHVEEAAEQTRVRVSYDEMWVRFVFECDQNSDPRALECASDMMLTRDDLIEFVIFPGDPERGMWLEVNPAGRYAMEGWTGATQRHDDARIELPLPVRMWRSDKGWGGCVEISVEGFGGSRPAPGVVWGLGLQRRNRGNGERSYWGGSGLSAREGPLTCGRLVFRQ